LALEPKCNANCIFCIGKQEFFSKGKEYHFSEKPDVKPEVLDKVKDIFEKLNYLYLTGHGESFNSKVFWQVINNKWPIKGIFFNTNGILLNKENIGELLNFKGNVNLGISLNATRSKTYQKLMRVDQFDKVVENAKSLKEISKKVGKGIQLTLSMVVFKENLDEMIEFCNIAKYVNADIVTIQVGEFAFDYNFKGFSVEEQDLRRNPDLMQKYNYNMKLVEERCSELGLVSHSKDASDEKWKGICKDIFEFLGISYDGGTFSCCNVSVDTGNLLDYSTFQDLWNNEKRKRMRELLIKGKFPKECQSPSCPYWRVKNNK